MPLHEARTHAPARLAAALALGVGKVQSIHELLRTYLRLIPRLGLIAATALFLADASERRPLSRVVAPFMPASLKIKPVGYDHPLTLRRADTDNVVVRQVLAFEEYRPVSRLTGVRLIVDCGANIGASAYYLLHRYPSARLVAIEPDPDNVALCRANLAPFGARAAVLHAAVWSECRPLRIAPASRGRGAWGRSVEPAAARDADVEGLTIPVILARAGMAPPIDLLKVDIEGAEVELFRDDPAWLHDVRNIAIELHGPAAIAAFDAALARFDGVRSVSGELTVVQGLQSRAPDVVPV